MSETTAALKNALEKQKRTRGPASRTQRFEILVLLCSADMLFSVTTSSDGLIFVKRRAKDGRFFSKNTGIRRAKRRAKFKLCIKKARKFDSRHFNNKSA